jgi:hypothetical protein
MGFFTTAGKNLALDSGLPDELYAALHNAAPGADGSAHELAGGAPAYARCPVVMAPAAGGARSMAAPAVFDVPPGDVAFASLWTAPAGGVCVALDDLAVEAFAGQGQYKLAAFDLAILDPA